jgi:hypothetical protein
VLWAVSRAARVQIIERPKLCCNFSILGVSEVHEQISKWSTSHQKKEK